MKLLCTWLQQPRLGQLEAAAIPADVAKGPGPGDQRDCHEREVGREAAGEPEADGLHRRAARAVLAYDIFPPRLVTPVLRRRPVEPGDTVGACYHLAPGLALFFAARVVACFDGPDGGLWRTGFTYRTLPGHPMVGEETFSVEKDLATGRVRVALRSWSRPGILLARAFYPLVRRWQVAAGRAALDHLAQRAAR